MGAAIRGVDADVFVSRSAGYHVGLVGLWAKLARRKFVYSSASLRDFDYQSFFEKWSDRIGFRVGLALADAIVVQTEEQVHLCERRFGRKSVLIRSISESAEQFDGRPEAFLWVGRVDRNKQPLEFVQLARSLPEARFQMVAKRLANTESGQLWDQIEAAALTLPNLDLLPSRPWPALLDLIARSVAVVSTSAFEGMPNVFLEGWARGVPALALNHDPDGVINRYGLGGFARGRPGRLIELASDLWANETARSECAARCREYVSLRHSSEVIGAKWERALPFSDESARRPVAMEAG
jgi:glycosyltransferase involved in cell wall biosynthesis